MRAEEEYRRAIQCLYLEVDGSIVLDVKRKCDAAIKECSIEFAIEQLQEVGYKLMETLDDPISKAGIFDNKIKELKSKLKNP